MLIPRSVKLELIICSRSMFKLRKKGLQFTVVTKSTTVTIDKK